MAEHQGQTAAPTSAFGPATGGPLAAPAGGGRTVRLAPASAAGGGPGASHDAVAPVVAHYGG